MQGWAGGTGIYDGGDLGYGLALDIAPAAGHRRLAAAGNPHATCLLLGNVAARRAGGGDVRPPASIPTSAPAGSVRRRTVALGLAAAAAARCGNFAPGGSPGGGAGGLALCAARTSTRLSEVRRWYSGGGGAFDRMARARFLRSCLIYQMRARA